MVLFLLYVIWELLKSHYFLCNLQINIARRDWTLYFDGKFFELAYQLLTRQRIVTSINLPIHSRLSDLYINWLC